MRIYKKVAQDPTLPQGFSITFRKRFWKKVNKDGPIPKSCPELGPCWIWTKSFQRYGYGAINRGNGKVVAAHRAAWMLFKGPIPQGLAVLHKCDTPACVNPKHLFLGTQTDNVHDMIAKNRGGPKNIVSEASVQEIRIKYETGNFSQSQLARIYGCSQPYVCELVARKCRRSVV